MIHVYGLKIFEMVTNEYKFKETVLNSKLCFDKKKIGNLMHLETFPPKESLKQGNFSGIFVFSSIIV